LAGDGDEGTGGPLAAGMDRAGQDALAGAALAAHEDGRSLAAVLKATSRLAHFRLGGLQVGLGHDGADLLLQLLDVRLEPLTWAIRSRTTRS